MHTATLAHGRFETRPRVLLPRWSVIDQLLSVAFAFLFIAQIFSPMLYGVTIYLEVVFALIHPKFVRWLLARPLSPKFALAILLFVVAISFSQPESLVKFAALAITVLYLAFLYDYNRFGRIFLMAGVSVLFALAQWLLSQVSPAAALSIGPEALSTAVWGEYATATWSNFYAVIGDNTRVAGLSREAGFFASLMVVLLVSSWFILRGKYRTFAVLVFAVGWILSLSKMSFALVPLVVLVWARKWIDKIPPLLSLMAFYLFAYVAAAWVRAIGLMDNDAASWLHRFGGFLLMPELSTRQLLFGEPSLAEINSPIASALYFWFQSAAGNGGFLVTYGLLGVLAWFMVMRSLEVTSAGLLFLLIASSNVNVATNQNFVVLAYFIAIYLMRDSPQRLTSPRTDHGKRSLAIG